MKKFSYFTFVFALISMNSFAQIIPKSYIVGGSSSFSYSDPGYNSIQQSTTQFSIAPKFGKFVSDKWLLDVSVGYDYYRYSYETNLGYNDSKTNGISAQFGATRFFPLVDRLYFTLNQNIQLGSSINLSTTMSTGNTTELKRRQYQAGLQLVGGLSYFITSKWSVQATLGSFNYQTTFDDNDRIGHQLGFSIIGNSFGVGVRYMLGTL